jgi:hypothetical protein
MPRPSTCACEATLRCLRPGPCIRRDRTLEASGSLGKKERDRGAADGGSRDLESRISRVQTCLYTLCIVSNGGHSFKEDPTSRNDRAVTVPAHYPYRARAGTMGRYAGPSTALPPGCARHGHDVRQAVPCLGRVY